MVQPMSLTAAEARPRRTLTPVGPKRGFPTPFTMAFQPIVDVDAGEVFAYEALVRGVGGEPASHVLRAVTVANRGEFDRDCRARAMILAKRLGMVQSRACLSINMLPQSVGDPGHGIEHTVAAATATGFPIDRIIFELTEHERLDIALLGRILRTHRRYGFRTAIDDFGAGHSGLTLLAAFQPDIVKLDMALIREIDASRVKQVMVGSIVRMCADLGVALVAEGIETVAEYATLRDLGVTLMQGYLLARPAFEALPTPLLPGGKRFRRILQS